MITLITTTKLNLLKIDEFNLHVLLAAIQKTRVEKKKRSEEGSTTYAGIPMKHVTFSFICDTKIENNNLMCPVPFRQFKTRYLQEGIVSILYIKWLHYFCLN